MVHWSIWFVVLSVILSLTGGRIHNSYNRRYSRPTHEREVNHHEDDSSDSSDDINKYDPDMNPYSPFPNFITDNLNFPQIFRRHCFGSSPFSSNCNGRTLTSVLLRQCLNIYHKAHYSVDILCPHIRKGAPGHIPPPTDHTLEDSDSAERDAIHGRHHQHAGGQYQDGASVDGSVGNVRGRRRDQSLSHPENSEYCSAMNGPREPIVGIVDYQYERCVQESYVSITAAMVMCLTENIVRREFINYYFQDAADNPVEGPGLYLKKLHSFMENVRKANRHNKLNEHYPNLYMPMVVGDEQTVKYNPNVPYLSKDDFPLDEVIGSSPTPIIMLIKAGHRAEGQPQDNSICDTDDLDENDCYRHSAWGHDMGEVQRCGDSHFIRHFGRDHLKRCRKGNEQYPRRRMYDCMRPRHHHVGKNDEDLDRRPESLIEAIVSSTVEDDFPALGGYGIPAYCALHACLATTKGNPEICFPESKGRNEYEFFQSDEKLWETQRLGQKFDICKANGWLDPDINSNSDLERLNDLIVKRSHTCITENELADFFAGFIPGAKNIDFLTQTGFLSLARGLTHQKCHEDDVGECIQPEILYEEIIQFLRKVLVFCEENRLRQESEQNKDECEKDLDIYDRPGPLFPNNCSVIVSDGDQNAGISAVQDLICFTGNKTTAPGGDNLGCFEFDIGCRYCKLKVTPQSKHLYSCYHFGHKTLTDTTTSVPTTLNCSSQVSEGDQNVGVSAYNDASCANGGLGCWKQQLCRFCKVLQTPQSKEFFPCPGVVITETQNDKDCQAQKVADADKAAGVSAYYDEDCLHAGLGCFSDSAKCRFCQLFRTDKSKHLYACPWTNRT